MTSRSGKFAILSLTGLLAFGIPNTGMAQKKGRTTKAEQKKVNKGPAPLDKKELADRLEQFKQDIASQVVSERIRKRGAKRVAKWMKGFHIIQSKHYLVFTNGPKTTVKRFSKSLEQLYDYVKKAWPFEDIDTHLNAYIFKMDTEYFEFCVKIAGWSLASAKATAGHASAKYYATYYQSPKSNVVMHEATHQIVNACIKVDGVGSWFQEGLAVYIEKKILGSKVSGNMRADLRNGNFYSMRDFVAIETLLSDPKGHGSRNYAHAGAIIEFMMESKDERMKGKFPAFLDAARKQYGRGAKYSEDLIRKVYGMSLEEFQQAFALFHKVKDAVPGQGRK